MNEFNHKLLAALVGAIVAAAALSIGAMPACAVPITPEEARAIAVDA